jgi:prepilin-type N-terminal cleavage/methylation domain-containing protein/prepilin-type processing-associated H-X9-DG protein
MAGVRPVGAVCGGVGRSKDMKRRAFTLVEVLVVIAVIAVLVGLLLSAVQSAREAARRLQCISNLKQIALASHDFCDANQYFPPGLGPSPFGGTSLVFILPYLEQGNVYNQFNILQDVDATPSNLTARNSQIGVYLCPSDPSVGKWVDPNPPPGQQAGIKGQANYYASLGARGWAYDVKPPLFKRPEEAGVFAFDSKTRFADITDGSSNTTLFGEIKRGARPGGDDLDVSVVPPNVWGPNDPTTNVNNLKPPAACDSQTVRLNYTGLEYHHGTFITALYTHTVPPNYKGRDCVRSITFDQAHMASRSYHPGGVNVAMADGSVRFIGDRIRPEVWRALGTKCGGELISADSY